MVFSGRKTPTKSRRGMDYAQRMGSSGFKSDLGSRLKRAMGLTLLGFILLGAVIGLGWLMLTTQGRAWRSDLEASWHAQHTQLQSMADVILRRGGLSPYKVRLSGLRRQSEKDILSLLPPYSKRHTLASIDLPELWTGIKRLPWIQSVVIHRRWPNNLIIAVQEREPLALWQNNRQLYLIDLGGDVIPLPSLLAYRHLPLVIGPGAPKKAQAFLEAISQTKVVKKTMMSATYVYNRRWNITLGNGTVIMLPQEGWQEALASLEKMESSSKLISRVAREHIKSIDLRTPPQVIIRLQEASARNL